MRNGISQCMPVFRYYIIFLMLCVSMFESPPDDQLYGIRKTHLHTLPFISLIDLSMYYFVLGCLY